MMLCKSFSKIRHASSLSLRLYRYVLFAVYVSEECQPDLQYIPDTHHIIAELPPGGDPLAGSMTLLRESIESNAAVAQFEVGSMLSTIDQPK